MKKRKGVRGCTRGNTLVIHWTHHHPTPQALEEWKAQEAIRQAAYDQVGTSADRDQQGDAAEAPQFIAYVPLPDTADIEAKVLNKKKADLLAKYTSDALAEKQQEAKDLLNKR